MIACHASALDGYKSTNRLTLLSGPFMDHDYNDKLLIKRKFTRQLQCQSHHQLMYKLIAAMS